MIVLSGKFVKLIDFVTFRGTASIFIAMEIFSKASGKKWFFCILSYSIQEFMTTAIGSMACFAWRTDRCLKERLKTTRRAESGRCEKKKTNLVLLFSPSSFVSSFCAGLGQMEMCTLEDSERICGERKKGKLFQLLMRA